LFLDPELSYAHSEPFCVNNLLLSDVLLVTTYFSTKHHLL